MASRESVRIRLCCAKMADEYEITVPNFWLLIDTNIIETVTDLIQTITRRFLTTTHRRAQAAGSNVDTGIAKIALELDGFMLPSDENIHVLRDGDMVRVIKDETSSNPPSVSGPQLTRPNNPPTVHSSDTFTVENDRNSESEMELEAERRKLKKTRKRNESAEGSVSKMSSRKRKLSETENSELSVHEKKKKKSQKEKNKNKKSDSTVVSISDKNDAGSTNIIDTEKASDSNDNARSNEMSLSSVNINNRKDSSVSSERDDTPSGRNQNTKKKRKRTRKRKKKSENGSVVTNVSQLSVPAITPDVCQRSVKFLNTVANTEPRQNAKPLRASTPYVGPRKGHVRFDSDSDAAEEITAENGQDAAVKDVDARQQETMYYSLLDNENTPDIMSEYQIDNDGSTQQPSSAGDCQIRLDYDVAEPEPVSKRPAEFSKKQRKRQKKKSTVALNNARKMLDDIQSNVSENPPKGSPYDSVDFSKYPNLEGPPRIGDTIAYKILEIGEDYCPSVSDYKIARVTDYDASTKNLHLEHISQTISSRRPGKFDIVDEDQAVIEIDPQVIINIVSLLEPKLVQDEQILAANSVTVTTDVETKSTGIANGNHCDESAAKLQSSTPSKCLSVIQNFKCEKSSPV
ncbi:uncharacterized protein LOC141903782 isoform X2 [Tubulanus polymorphus]|uniref:uncharacterized protein LOC141903782 isoform X2 n=1 Tax=Tubulanus polymorphus TaxID=672921 RepID=UPI003DA41BDF